MSVEQPKNAVSLRESTWQNKWLLVAGLFLAAWYSLRFWDYERIAQWPSIIVLVATGLAPTVFMLLYPILTCDNNSSRLRVPRLNRWLVEMAVSVPVVIGTMFLLGILNNLVWQNWPGETITPPAIENMARTGTPRFVYPYLIFGCTLAPLAEEMFFRGFLYNALRRRVPIVLACAVQAIVFGFAHMFGTMHAVIASALGILLAFVYEWRKTLIAPFMVHSGMNVLSAIAIVGMMSAYADGPMLGVFGDSDESLCVVTQVVADSPASAAGILVGDRILSFDDQTVESFSKLRSLIEARQPGDKVTLIIVRDDETMEIPVALGRRGSPEEWR